MRKDWEIKKLVDIAKVSTGKWDANHANENGEYRFYTCAYHYGMCDTKRFFGECLVLPGNGVNVGEVFYYNGEFDAYQRTYVISNIKIFPKYLYYHMLLYWKKLGTKLQYGSATNFIKIGNFQDYDVAFPVLLEQKRIVSILDKVFADIEKVKDNTEENLQSAKEIFENHLHNILITSGNDWEIKKLDEICDFINGLWTGKKPPFQKVGVIRNTNFTKNGNLDFSDIAYLDVEQSKFKNRKLKFGDIVLEKSGGGPKQPVGRVVIFNKKEGDFSFSNFTSIIRIKNLKDVDFNYLHKVLFNFYISGRTEKMQSHSTGIRNLKFDEYKAIEIPLPPLPKQKSIVKKIDDLSNETKKLEDIYKKKINNLVELKKSILQKAFNGDL